MKILHIRWLTITWYLLYACEGQLPNLRPLKGILNDFEPPINATDRIPAGAPDTQTPSTRVGPILDLAFNDGVAAAVQQQEIQNSRPDFNLEPSARFLSDFRKAEPDAAAASCVGRALIETTKIYASRLGIDFKEAVRRLTGIKLDHQKCQQILKKNGCEDFPPPDPCSKNDPYRRIDGSCNNLNNPSWGRAFSPFIRFYYPFYENGIDSMRGDGRNGTNRLPSPRTVSYRLVNLTHPPENPNITLMVMAWGQFIDHDFTFTAETQLRKPPNPSTSTVTSILMNPQQDDMTCPVRDDTLALKCCPNGKPVDDQLSVDCRPIDVSQDPLHQTEGRVCMRFVRSLIASKGCVLGPREQLNQLTAYLDSSMLYGSTDTMARNLREGSGGRMKKTKEGDLLPRTCCRDGSFTCFEAGDVRVNLQIGLTSMHTLWLRVHEQIVAEFALHNPTWDDEKLYQETRRVVIALMQQITYREFLPIILGPNAMDEFDLHLLSEAPGLTYDDSLDASIANVVATAAFRFGHSLVYEEFQGSGVVVPLVGNFFNPKVLFEHKTRPSAILKGMSEEDSESMDYFIIEELTDRLFSKSYAEIGLDLYALNIQRGRDHGLPPYNIWRKACNLRTFSSFYELSTVMPAEVVQVFQETYSDVNEIDLFPAGISEYPVYGGLLGPTFACLIGQQFSNLKKGDRYFFQNLMQPKPFTPEQLESIKEMTFSAIICKHTDIQEMQPNAFLTTNVTGNDLRPCSSYPTLNSSLWKEKKMPPPDVMKCRAVGYFQGNRSLDKWCTLNCFHGPSFCPPTHCSCEGKRY